MLIATTIRLGIFFLMEIFNVNSLIWFYDWSIAERCIQITLIVAYFLSSIILPVLSKMYRTVSIKHRKAVAITEGIVSTLIICFVLSSAKITSVHVWLVLFIQIYIGLISAINYFRATKRGKR